MKKIVSILLAAVLALGMTAAVFAGAVQEATTTVRTVIPSASYTMVVPATLDLIYGESGHLMETAITDIENFKEGDSVRMSVSWTDLSSGNNVIPLNILVSTYENGELVTELQNPREEQIMQIAYMHGYEGYSVEYYAYIEYEDWEAAAPGSYEGSVCFTSMYEAAQHPEE